MAITPGAERGDVQGVEIRARNPEVHGGCGTGGEQRGDHHGTAAER